MLYEVVRRLEVLHDTNTFYSCSDLWYFVWEIDAQQPIYIQSASWGSLPKHFAVFVRFTSILCVSEIQIRLKAFFCNKKEIESYLFDLQMRSERLKFFYVSSPYSNLFRHCGNL